MCDFPTVQRSLICPVGRENNQYCRNVIVNQSNLYNSTPVRISALQLTSCFWKYRLFVLDAFYSGHLFLTTQDQTKCGPEVFLLKPETISIHICRLLDIYRLNCYLKDSFRIFSRNLRSSPK